MSGAKDTLFVPAAIGLAAESVRPSAVSGLPLKVVFLERTESQLMAQLARREAGPRNGWAEASAVLRWQTGEREHDCSFAPHHR